MNRSGSEQYKAGHINIDFQVLSPKLCWSVILVCAYPAKGGNFIYPMMAWRLISIFSMRLKFKAFEGFEGDFQ